MEPPSRKNLSEGQQVPNLHHDVNPFAYTTPEDIKAEDALFLFVDVFTDFFKILRSGHTFVHGPRGCGKSMMFRYMLPDCQLLADKKGGGSGQIKNLDYFAVYIPIKLTDVHVIELDRLENKHANLLLNEHWMTITVLERLFMSFIKVIDLDTETSFAEIGHFYETFFSPLLTDSGWTEPLPEISEDDTPKTIFSKMSSLSQRLRRIFTTYIRQLTQSDKPIAYQGLILGYLDFFLPLITELRKLTFMPEGPVFLLFDDADNLSDTQQTVLNTWVSYRTSGAISIKASTQLNYGTWYTMSGITIDTPHDFAEINISDVYTNQKKGNYRKRLEQIVLKRLELVDLDVKPSQFFPGDKKQEAAIKRFAKNIQENFETEGRGFRASDDVTRYARPRYMASLKGTSKNASTYSYSGFEQLVHISSGIIRHFLEAASLMYGEMQAKDPNKPVVYIDPSVQNNIVRQLADKFLFSEFEKLESPDITSRVIPETVRKLRNLVEGLGRMFETILISDASEIRVFSIAFSDRPDKEILDVLKLGVRYGYFHESSIGLKDGTGRTKLYILSRRLAPHFSLDPTSFAGYKFVTSKLVHEAMRRPDALVGKVKRKGFDNVFREDSQLSLDFD